MDDTETNEPFLGTRYYFLVDAPGYDRLLLMTSSDIVGWLTDPQSNAIGCKFNRLVGMAHGEDGNWFWKSDDFYDFAEKADV